MPFPEMLTTCNLTVCIGGSLANPHSTELKCPSPRAVIWVALGAGARDGAVQRAPKAGDGADGRRQSRGAVGAGDIMGEITTRLHATSRVVTDSASRAFREVDSTPRL
jgi:hypothetical protein